MTEEAKGIAMRAQAAADDAMQGVRRLQDMAGDTKTSLAVLSEQMGGIKESVKTLAEGFAVQSKQNSEDHRSVIEMMRDGLGRVHARIDDSNKETAKALEGIKESSNAAMTTALASVETERTARLKLQIRFLTWGCGALLVVLGTIAMAGLPWDKLSVLH